MTDAPDVLSESVDLRMTPDTRRTLERAASASNKSLADFLVDSGLDAAADTMSERRVFRLDEKRWDAFMVALDTPPQENPRLRALLARKPVWNK